MTLQFPRGNGNVIRFLFSTSNNVAEIKGARGDERKGGQRSDLADINHPRFVSSTSTHFQSTKEGKLGNGLYR